MNFKGKKLQKTIRRVRRYWQPTQRSFWVRVGTGTIVLAALISLYAALHPDGDYQLTSNAKTLLPEARSEYASALKKDGNNLAYNKGYTPAQGVGGLSSQARFTATFHGDASKGLTVVDPQTNVEFTLKPLFGMKAPKADGNRVVQPIKGKDAQSVYTLQAAQMKDDLIINRYQGDSLTFDYKLELPDGTEARMEQNGGVGVYSVDPNLLGNVTTGSEADQTLLQQALKNGEKTTLLFTLPAPYIKEFGTNDGKARAWYSLDGDTLTLRTEGLKDANYPLSIDPTIYIETATKLMQGNNESNVDFDVSNELIQKGKTTGGRFDDWVSDSLSLPSARWGHTTAFAGGYVYVVGGSNGSTAQGNLYWAKVDPNFTRLSTPGTALTTANPGDGACASWCTNSAYNLPSSATRRGASMVAYNGYLYLFGGLSDAGSRTDTVFIAKLGANGEPQRWHPSDSDTSNWDYWYEDTTLDTARTYTSAVAYNNRMYLIGGTTNASTGGTTTVRVADINPTGVLTNWASETSLPAARWGTTTVQYNGYIYVVGGANAGTAQTSVYYTKINDDGSLNSWQTGTSMGTARVSMGGSFATIWGGYLYAAGGCNAPSGSGGNYYCTSGNTASDIQLASINGDGSITDWTSILGVTSSRTNYTLDSWRGNLYAIGGCSSQTAVNSCSTNLSTVQYGLINQDGDASTVSTSVPNGTAPCDSTNSYYNCDLPPQGDSNGQTGRMSGGAIINNGYIYYMGGCTAVGNNSVCYTGNSGKATDNVGYAAIDSVGHITRISSCAGQFVGSWCVINGGMGASLAAFSYAVFNNTLYIIGGTTGTEWQDDVWRTTFNADGTWGSWSSQTFAATGLGSAKGYQYAFTRANPSQASTYPGNLYVLGGCSGVTAADNGLDCSGTLYTQVYKCWIKTDGSLETSGSTCTTSGQLQIDAEPGTGGSQGLGVAAGTVYANYVYLIGGQSPNEDERGEVMYAKIDNSNNIVAVSGSSWITSSYGIDPVRRRGIAFGYNGYLYALAGFNVSEGGSLNDLLYAKIDVSDGSISSFQTSLVTVNPRWDLRTIVNNGYVYAIGGCEIGQPPASCRQMTGTVQTFQLYNNYSGSPKAYTTPTVTSLTDRYGAGAAVLNGYLYVAGGCTVAATYCSTPVNTVQYTQINSDGSLNSWSSGGTFTTATGWGKLVAAGGTLYYIGGQTGNTNNGVTTVYSATPASNGSISSWSSSNTALPAGRTQFGAAVWNDRIYVVGGYNGSGTAQSTVYVSPQQSSGGTIGGSWSTASTSFNVARAAPGVVAYANNLYVLGGYTGSEYLSDVQYSQINTSTGNAGSWTYSTSLPTAMSGMDGFARQWVYVPLRRAKCRNHLQ